MKVFINGPVIWNTEKSEWKPTHSTTWAPYFGDILLTLMDREDGEHIKFVDVIEED